MKANFKYLNQFIRYHWKYSMIEEAIEKNWSHKVVSISPASQCQMNKFYSSQNIFNKSFSLFKMLGITLWNSATIKPSNRIERFEKQLKSNHLSQNIYKEVSFLPNSFQPVFLITDPNIITGILMHERNETGEHALFSGGEPTQIAKKILGNNILTCPEDEHKTLQQFSSPHFVSHAIGRYSSSFSKSSSQLIQQWLEQGENTPINVSGDLAVFAAGAVAENLLGFKGSTQVLCTAMNTLLIMHQKKVMFPKHKRLYQDAIHFIQTSAEEAAKSENHNLLKCMKEAKDKNGQPKFQLEDVISMAKIMFFAGQDSTSSLLAFILYMLGQPSYVDWQEKLYSEYKKEGDLFQFIHQSNLLDNLFKESLRYHPSAYTQTRETVQDLVIDDRFFIPKGSFLYLLHYFSQRDSRRWGNESLLFNPLRFENSALNAKNHGPFQYFSLGPSICLGRHFVMLLMKTFLMEMICNVTWRSCAPEPKLEAEIMIDLKPHVSIQLTRRK